MMRMLIPWARCAWLPALLHAGCGSSANGVVADAGSDATRSAGDADVEDEGAADLPQDASPSDANASATDARSEDARSASTDTGTPDAGSGDAGARTDGGGTLCPELGWCELRDTKLSSVCPDPAKFASIQANEGCSGVINDWSGGCDDPKRQRLIVWGGGHRGYFGNELYALDLGKLRMERLNDPSALDGVDLTQCASPEAYADGRPSSRHTYDGLAYVADQDAMFSLGGSGIPCGYAVQGTWLLDLAKVASAPPGAAAPWTQKKPSPFPSKAAYGVIADYDPNTKRVIVNDTYSLWSYDAAQNVYSVLNDSTKTNAHIDYHMTGRVDPKRKLFVAVGGKGQQGGGLQVFDLDASSDHAQQDWTSQVTGCDDLLRANSPGLAYDPVQDRMIGWAGGDAVVTLDLDQKRCTTRSFPGGPGPQNDNGTFGRFRYFAALEVFALVNAHDRNAYTLRLTQ